MNVKVVRKLNSTVYLSTT